MKHPPRRMWLSTFFVISALAAAPGMSGCSSGGTGNAGTGGKAGSGSGGTASGSGGATSSGGAVGSGGAVSTGGTVGSGGVNGTGGRSATGGAPGGGGTTGTGGTTGGTGGGGLPDGGTNMDAMSDSGTTAGTTYVYVSGNSSTIRVYKLDLATGMLQAAGMSTDGGSNPTYMAFHPNKKFAYAVNESGANSKILAFSIDAATGALTKLAQNGEAATSPGQGPPHLSVHSSGKWIYAAHFNSGHTTVHAIMTNGGVGAPASNDKTANSEAHQAKQDPTGKYLLVPCRTPNYVAQYKIDETTGALTANTTARVTPPMAGTGPRHMDFHPNGKWAYVLGETNGHVVSYNYDGATGLLSSPQDVAVQDGEMSGAHILVHPGGQFVFASLRTKNEIATLSVDATTGRLTVKSHQTSMISGPRDFTIDPSGRYLLVGNTSTGTVLVFAIGESDGALTFKSSVTATGISQPQFVGTLVLP